MYFITLFRLCFAITTAEALIQHSHNAKRYDNGTLANLGAVPNNATTATMAGNVAIDAQGYSTTIIVQTTALNNLGDQATSPTGMTTITRRTTVTVSPTLSSNTPWPSSILFDPQVAIVAAVAPPTSETSSGVSVKTVYLPTTIYITNPCVVASSTPTQPQSVSSSALRQAAITTQTVQNSVAAVMNPVQSSIVASAAVQGAAVAAAQVSTGASTATAAAQEVVSYSTLKVTQTLISTTTVMATLSVSTSSTTGLSLLQGISAPYMNGTRS